VVVFFAIRWGLYSKEDRAVARQVRKHLNQHPPKKPPTRWMT
jgi:hypothetical protein